MTNNPNEIRIIGGKWRGRKIKILPDPHIRPTPNRVRETLFNWLTPFIQNAQCLDLFAGSGALGFEALSRGAAHMVMMDKSPLIINQLKENAAILKTHNIDFICKKFTHNMKNIFPQTFDIVFLDPPFYQSIIKPSLEWLRNNNCLTNKSLIYIEQERAANIPTEWEIYRSKKAGQVSYNLVYLA